MNLVRITDHALTRKDDIFLPEKTILRLARRIEKERNGGQKTATVRISTQSETSPNSSPLKFIAPSTVVTVDKDLNNTRTFTLTNNPYHTLRFICQMPECCALISEVANGVGIPEDSVLNAVKNEINPAFRKNGVMLTLKVRNGYLRLFE